MLVGMPDFRLLTYKWRNHGSKTHAWGSRLDIFSLSVNDLLETDGIRDGPNSCVGILGRVQENCMHGITVIISNGCPRDTSGAVGHRKNLQTQESLRVFPMADSGGPISFLKFRSSESVFRKTPQAPLHTVSSPEVSQESAFTRTKPCSRSRRAFSEFESRVVNTGWNSGLSFSDRATEPPTKC